MNDMIEKAQDAIMACEQQLMADGVDLEAILSAMELRVYALREEVDGQEESLQV
jgi:hypothetical protein